MSRMGGVSYNEYNLMSNEELHRRIDYDIVLLKQPAIHTITVKKIREDRIACEAELEKRRK